MSIVGDTDRIFGDENKKGDFCAVLRKLSVDDQQFGAPHKSTWTVSALRIDEYDDSPFSVERLLPALLAGSLAAFQGKYALMRKTSVVPSLHMDLPTERVVPCPVDIDRYCSCDACF